MNSLMTNTAPSKASDTETVIDRNVALCVDLDGTLIRTDLLFESFLYLLKKNVLYMFLVPIWLLKGKAHLRKQIADRANITVNLLPYHQQLLEFLRSEAALGRKIILAAASDRTYAQKIAEHLDLFDVVLASDGHTNLSGHRKLKCIVEQLKGEPFDYAGNAKDDMAIWAQARQVLLVNPEPGVKRASEKLGKVVQLFEDRRAGILAYIKAIRPHQWLKNLLVFVPMVAAHIIEQYSMMQSLLAFVAFSLCASSAYVLNDMLDLDADRQHDRKRLRPFASGEASVKYGAVLFPILAFSGLLSAMFISPSFLLVVTTYYILTIAYSISLKNMVIVDVLLLATLYTLRIIAGATAIDITPSFWLLAFSMFVFLSLALLKRYSELYNLKQQSKEKVNGRGYIIGDLQQIGSLGISSGYMAVVVLALYIDSPMIEVYYDSPLLIWMLCPLLLYWVNRIWLIAGRGEVHDDPLLFTLKDKSSHIVAALWALILFAAT